MHGYVERYEIIATSIRPRLILINLQSLTWKSKNPYLKIKKPKKPKNLTF